GSPSAVRPSGSSPLLFQTSSPLPGSASKRSTRCPDLSKLRLPAPVPAFSAVELSPRCICLNVNTRRQCLSSQSDCPTQARSPACRTPVPSRCCRFADTPRPVCCGCTNNMDSLARPTGTRKLLLLFARWPGTHPPDGSRPRRSSALASAPVSIRLPPAHSYRSRCRRCPVRGVLPPVLDSAAPPFARRPAPSAQIEDLYCPCIAADSHPPGRCRQAQSSDRASTHFPGIPLQLACRGFPGSHAAHCAPSGRDRRRRCFPWGGFRCAPAHHCSALVPAPAPGPHRCCLPALAGLAIPRRTPGSIRVFLPPHLPGST